MKVWLDGRLVRADAPAIAATDPAVLYGLGLFEVTRAYGRVPFRLHDHLERMRRSAAHFALPLPPDDATVKHGIRALCRRNHLPDAYVRITLTAGGRVFIVVRPLDIPSPREYRQGAAITVRPWRHDPAAPLYGHKTLNYLENVRTRQQARKAGFADSLALGLRGEILEGCASNVFLVRRGDLATPSLGQHILPGVTRGVVLDIAARLGLRVSERAVPIRELATADEVLLTGSTMEIVPVTRLDRRRIGRSRPGPITRLLAMAYRAVVLTETTRDRRPPGR